MSDAAAKHVRSGIARVRRWFNLGLEEDQLVGGQRIKQVEHMFAKDNLAIMPTVCAGATVVLLLLMLSRAQLHGYTFLNTVPFIVGMVICVVVACVTRLYRETIPVRCAVALVYLISLTWFSLAIYANLVLQPEKPSVLLCLMLASIPLLFDAMPKRMLFITVIAFAAMTYTEFTLVPESVQHTDFNNAIIGMLIGLGCGQMKSASKVKAQTNLEMFKTATKIAEVVVQIDLRRGTFELLKTSARDGSPNSEEHDITQVMHHISEKFVAPEYQQAFESFFDISSLPDRMGDKRQISLEVLSSYGKWNRVTIVEERRWNGKVSAVVAVILDIDAEKRQELEYREKLHEAVVDAERANASKSNFLRRMSHDIRTPINGISGIVRIGERFPDDMEKQAECRKKVIEASNYLTLLVNNILDMSKLESGAVELEEKPFDIREVIGDVALVARTQATDHAVRFSVTADGGSVQHPHLIGSPVHFQQILHNLCNNAIKYNRQGGSVSLCCKETSFDGEVALFLIKVSDTGLGISKEFLGHVFEPFAQEHKADSGGTYVGSGLGLSIVKEFTESMGGSIDVTSEEGVGTTFELHLPFKVDKAPAKAPEDRAEVKLKGKKALVAEDNDLNREIIEFVLRDMGLEVVSVCDGEKAVDSFASSKPGEFDVVMLDIMMPVMDGLEATREIRALNRKDAKSVPIFAMTANAFRDDIERSYEAGINEHLTKPLETAKVVDALQRWLH